MAEVVAFMGQATMTKLRNLLVGCCIAQRLLRCFESATSSPFSVLNSFAVELILLKEQTYAASHA